MIREESAGGGPWRIIGWGLAAMLLATPAAMMALNVEGWKWGSEDFIFAALVIGGTGLLFEFALRRSQNLAYRAGAACALLAAFGLVWVNAAVGFIGAPGDPLNLGFLGILLVALSGAAFARMRATGLSWTMLAAALGQLLMAGVAMRAEWVLWMPSALFIALWLASAACFRKASTDA